MSLLYHETILHVTHFAGDVSGHVFLIYQDIHTCGTCSKHFLDIVDFIIHKSLRKSLDTSTCLILVSFRPCTSYGFPVYNLQIFGFGEEYVHIYMTLNDKLI